MADTPSSIATELARALNAAVSRAQCPGAVACVGDADKDWFAGAVGARALEPEHLPARVDTLYDLASLTKVVATTTAALLLCEDGVLSLDQPVTEIVPIPAFRSVTIRHLLTHTSGLPAGKPFYKTCTSVDEMLQLYADGGLDWAPGSRRRYSDAGYLLLGRAVELAAHDSLDAFCRRRIFEPLGMADTHFNPPRDEAPRCAATERCAWRGRVMQGQVHDENAYAVGGVAGHAGLFSTAGDLARFCRAFLSGALLKPATVEAATRPMQVPSYPWQGLGWQLDPWASASTGYLPSRAALGHTGWTGTSLWMDRDTGLFAILLGNTCHPSRSGRDSRTFRAVFHDAVARLFYPARTNAHTGLDRLVWDGFDTVAGKRLALLTNAAAVDQWGRTALDVLRGDPRADLRLVYSPEHGLRGQAEAGGAVSSEDGALPVISLYGKRTRPSPEELAGIDLFIIDLPDVGSRYYTYPATMKACLQACAAAGKPVLVLDRPNPVGGVVIEGPIAVKADAPVCYAPIPVRHAMTLGELARYFQQTALAGTRLRLEVSLADNWPRDRLFSACALPWVPPSPNMPTPLTALLYVGTCLFEGTNLNEGRGTDTPFEVIGAPWLEADAVCAAIGDDERAGATLEPVTYTPRSLPGKAASPRYCDAPCRGIHIAVTDPAVLRPFTLATALLAAIRRIHPKDFQWGPSFDTLTGSGELRRRIDGGESARAIVASSDEALKAFGQARVRLYPLPGEEWPPPPA